MLRVRLAITREALNAAVYALVGVFLIALSAALGGCGGGRLAPVDSRDGYGPAPSGFYRIRRGDTLSEIAERRRLSMSQLAAWNDLSAPYDIYSGNLLRIEPPDGSTRRRMASRSAGASTTRRPGRVVQTTARPPGAGANAASSGIAWQWPLHGRVQQGFRSGDRTRQGIRIAADLGAPVGAAADGSVVYSGSGLKGYGNLIIVKHNNRYLSAYGFNRVLLVREGDKVKRGQRLAEVGQAANGESLLHFEIRRDGVAVDPLRFLPASH
jgi:lipoprotein NlpD